MMDEFLSMSRHADFEAINHNPKLQEDTISGNSDAFWYQLKETSFNGIIFVSSVRRSVLFKLKSCKETYRCTL